MSKHVSVVCDSAQGLLTCELTIAAGATVAEVLALARERLGLALVDRQPVGIYGQACGLDHVPEAGDRIELYRALPTDPRVARRARAARGAGAIKRGRDT